MSGVIRALFPTNGSSLADFLKMCSNYKYIISKLQGGNYGEVDIIFYPYDSGDKMEEVQREEEGGTTRKGEEVRSKGNTSIDGCWLYLDHENEVAQRGFNTNILSYLETNIYSIGNSPILFYTDMLEWKGGKYLPNVNIPKDVIVEFPILGRKDDIIKVHIDVVGDYVKIPHGIIERKNHAEVVRIDISHNRTLLLHDDPNTNIKGCIQSYIPYFISSDRVSRYLSRYTLIKWEDSLEVRTKLFISDGNGGFLINGIPYRVTSIDIPYVKVLFSRDLYANCEKVGIIRS
jgi:hypothetical protein